MPRRNAAIPGAFDARARGATNASKAVGVMRAEVVERVAMLGIRVGTKECRGLFACWARPKVENSTDDVTMGMPFIQDGALDEEAECRAASG